MSIFREWLKKRGLKEGLDNNQDPVADFKFNSPDKDYAEDHDRLEMELFKTVWRKYPEETMDFLSSLSQKGDNELNALLRKVDKNQKPRLSREPQHPKDGEEVRIPVADGGFSGDSID